MITYVTPEELRDDSLTCRLLVNHSWKSNPEYELNSDLAKLSASILALRCVRCGRERFDYINRHGELIGRYYRNPGNFQYMHRIPLTELRKLAMERSLLVHNFERNGRRKSNGKN